MWRYESTQLGNKSPHNRNGKEFPIPNNQSDNGTSTRDNTIGHSSRELNCRLNSDPKALAKRSSKLLQVFWSRLACTSDNLQRVAFTLIQLKFSRMWTRVFNRLATQCKLVSVLFSLGRARTHKAVPLFFFSFLQLALNLCLLASLFGHPSPICQLALSCVSVCPEPKRELYPNSKYK